MAYGQKNYTEKMGNGPYTIAEIGCLLTAFCNLAERFGIHVDPPTLNDFFNNGHYLAAPEDGPGVKDDLGWTSITGYNSQIVVTGTGAGGWPSSNNAIVKFHYRSISNPTLANGQPNMIDHFCLVADHNAGTIVDSWDGVVKQPGAYGEPVGWATFGGPTVQSVTPPPAPAASASSTERLGNVNVAGLDLSAAMKADLAAGMSVVDFNAKYSATPGFQPIATSRQLAPVAAPAPAPAPSIPEVPAPAPAPAKPPIVYTKLATPLDLVTNKQPTNWWELNFTDDAHATAAAQLNVSTPFVAYGMAQRTDGDKPAYYMTQEDFGNADTTGTPTNNNGINTVDLSPAPTPAPAPAADPAPEAPAPASAAPAQPAADGESVPVTVSSWQNSYKAHLSPQRYVAISTLKVEDLAGEHDDVELLKGQSVSVAGIFDKDGVKYFRTVKSVQSGVWYGIPVTALKRLDSAGDDDEIDKIIDDIKKEGGTLEKTLSAHEKALVSGASVEGFLDRIFHRKKKG